MSRRVVNTAALHPSPATHLPMDSFCIASFMLLLLLSRFSRVRLCVTP